MQHVLYKCPGTDNRCVEGRCQWCGGRLAYCPTCGGAEGSLPTECPGGEMDRVTEDRVTKGEVDFVNGAWVELPRGREEG
jgi:hypothetical protein